MNNTETTTVEISQETAADPAQILENYEDTSIYATFGWSSATTLKGASFQVYNGYQVASAEFVEGTLEIILGDETTEPMHFIEFTQELVEEHPYPTQINLNLNAQGTYTEPRILGNAVLRPKLR